MFFDFHHYRTVLAFAWGQKQWPKRNKTLFKLLLVVPISSAIHALFFLLDYVFFPALWRQKVEQPVFIVGHARSGTTLMHRLMAADGDRFSYFLYWETFLPALTERKIVQFIGWIDRRLLTGRIKARLQAWDEKTFGPYRHIHNMGLWIPEEDQFVMKAAFVTQQWSIDLPLMHKSDIFHIDDLSETRRRRWMHHYKECVKRQLLSNGGNKIHLSKNPVMSGWVNAILDTFPDARIVVMMRDPVSCIPSTLKLVESSWARNNWTAQQWKLSLDVLTEISFDSFKLPQLALAERPDTPQYVVDYRELTGAPSATTQAVYGALGLDVSVSYRLYLDQQEQKEKAHTSHFQYKLGDYELAPERIESELESFYQRYNWPRHTAQLDPRGSAI